MKFRLLAILSAAVLAAPAVLTAPASAAVRAPASGISAPASPLPWIENDWPRAVSLARQRKVPIFVENWAPW